MKNAIIGLSGGPSVAINASLAGVIKGCMKSGEIDKVYGMLNGITGVLNKRFVDLTEYSDDLSLQLMCQTPAMALGSCRHKLKEESFPQIIETLQEMNIGYFFYIGGNDSMDTAHRLSKYCIANNIDIKVNGVPKTIDNDLPITDHTPGFGSCAKYLYHTVNEIYRDSSVYPTKNVFIVEVMGRNSGWLTLGAALPRFVGKKFPQIIALPEQEFDEKAFIAQIEEELKTTNTVLAVVSEGIKSNGNYVGADIKSDKVDAFGHATLRGAGKYLEDLVNHCISTKMATKVRSIELNVVQRCAAHLASKTDIDEAFLIGQKAVELALTGATGKMMVYKRLECTPYKMVIESTDAGNVANKAKDVPQEWFSNIYDKDVHKAICEYMLPLIEGSVVPICDETGLPIYIDLREMKNV